MRDELCDEAIRLGQAARSAHARRARGVRPRRADAPPRLAARDPLARRRAGAARGPGPLALGPEQDRRGHAGARPGGQPTAARARTSSRPRSRPSTPRRRQPADTDWHRIAAIYLELGRINPSPVVELNRAVAVAMADGPEEGLALIDELDSLDSYHLFHSARADLLRRLDRRDDARAAYERALAADVEPGRAGVPRAPAGGGRLSAGVQSMVEPLRRVLVRAPRPRGRPALARVRVAERARPARARGGARSARAAARGDRRRGRCGPGAARPEPGLDLRLRSRARRRRRRGAPATRQGTARCGGRRRSAEISPRRACR